MHRGRMEIKSKNSERMEKKRFGNIFSSHSVTAATNSHVPCTSHDPCCENNIFACYCCFIAQTVQSRPAHRLQTYPQYIVPFIWFIRSCRVLKVPQFFLFIQQIKSMYCTSMQITCKFHTRTKFNYNKKWKCSLFYSWQRDIHNIFMALTAANANKRFRVGNHVDSNLIKIHSVDLEKEIERE